MNKQRLTDTDSVLVVCKYVCGCLIERLANSNSSLLEYIQSHRGCLQTRHLVTDYVPALRAIARAEDLRKATNSKRR